ncbi:UNVERIFIED_ORG: hypothetical protein M2402_003756 [Rahnella aquatilis]
MVNDNTALCHHFFKIAQAEGISQISANTLSNNIEGIEQAFEGFSYQRHEQATSQKNSILPDEALMRENPRQNGRASIILHKPTEL